MWSWLTAASPATAVRDPAVIKIDAEKAKAWIANGAQPTDTVRYLLKKSEIL